jgi:hypothetical protein
MPEEGVGVSVGSSLVASAVAATSVVPEPPGPVQFVSRITSTLVMTRAIPVQNRRRVPCLSLKSIKSP